MSKPFAKRNLHLDSTIGLQLKKQFQGNSFNTWLGSAQDLLDQGIPHNLINRYATASLGLVESCGSEAVFEFSKTLLFILEHAGDQACSALIAHAHLASTLLTEEDEFSSWLTSIREIAAAAPRQVKQVCSKTSTLLSQLDAVGFHRWVAAGITSAGHDDERLERYFSLENPASLHVLELESSDVRLASVERRLSGLMTGLWGLSPIIRAIEVKKAQHSPRRASFDGNFIRLPNSFSGYRAKQAENLFKAAITHIGAHTKFTRDRLKPKALKPIQLAIISILEDTRVELLASRQYPGLLNLWRSFHTVQARSVVTAEELSESENSACFVVADTAPTTEKLLERLARALIDPDFKDDNPWVEKGKKLFFDLGPDWQDPEDLRRVGVLLGNDIGQMRLQFNSKTYVVQPPYRDDNMGIWDFSDTPPEMDDSAEVIQGSFRIEQTDDPDETNQKQQEDSDAEQESRTGKISVSEGDVGIPIDKLPEWDYVAASQRPDWVTIMEYQPPTAPARIISHLLSEHADIERRISTLVNQSRVGRPTRLKRQPEGDRLDLDACIQSRIDYIAGFSTNEGIYETSALLHRDLSILVLLDISDSTKDLINGTANSIFSIERTATALLAQAMDGIGDPFAIRAFCSNGRHDLRYCRIKDFDADYDDVSKGRLAGLRPGFSTRMGAALRYAGSEIHQQQTHRRLVLVITDGEPSDIDIDDKKYLIEDARKAVHELAHDAINVFAVGLGSDGDDYLSRIFGSRNTIQIDRIENLPVQLPMLYFRLVA